MFMEHAIDFSNMVAVHGPLHSRYLIAYRGGKNEKSFVHRERDAKNDNYYYILLS